MKFKDYLKQVRKNKWLTQNEFAQVLWISKISLAFFESWSREPTKLIIKKIAKYLDIHPKYLAFFLFEKELDIDNTINKRIGFRFDTDIKYIIIKTTTWLKQ